MLTYSCIYLLKLFNCCLCDYNLVAVNDIIYKSARNIKGVKVSPVNALSVYDIMNCNKIVIAKDAVAKLEEVYA